LHSYLPSNTFPDIDIFHHAVNIHTQLAHSIANHSIVFHQSSYRSPKQAKFDFRSYLARVQFWLILGLIVHRKFTSLAVVNQFHSIDSPINYHHIKYSGSAGQNFGKVATNRTIIIQYC